MQVLARQKPLLMIFEDLHWIDPTSLEARGRMVDRLRTLSVLLIVTYGPESEPPWMGWPYVTALILNRLGERETAAIIDSLPGTSCCHRVSDRTLSSAQTAFLSSSRS